MMTTSTILRVKRRLEENPQDALVLMCKRIKTDVEEVTPSVFVFHGTVANKDTTLVDTINTAHKQNAKLKQTTDVNDILQKLRKERKEAAAKRRYEVVKCSRGLKENEESDIVDLIDLTKLDDEECVLEYAYDLYTSTKQVFDISMIENLVGIESCNVDLVCNNDSDNQSDNADDEEDSNDENNWRNDYPESDASTIDEEEMIRCMERVDLDDLSSDIGEDNIYDYPSHNYRDDANDYGEAYANYKAIIKSEDPTLVNSNSLIQCSLVKEPDEGYKDDSDDGFYYGQDQDTEQYPDQYNSDTSNEYSSD